MREENMINPDALKAARKRRNMTQEQLAEAVKCTKDTVSRWERGISRVVRSRHRDSLCEVLRLDWEELSGTMDEDLRNSRPEPGKTKVTININLRNALHLVAERYGISVHDVINLAPLLLVIVAEQSLVWRQNRLVEIYSTLTKMEEKSIQFSKRLGETLDVRGTAIENSLLEESESLKNRDVFGRFISSSNALWDRHVDPEDPHGTFIDFIGDIRKSLPEEAVMDLFSFDGKMINDYTLAGDTIKSLTGLSLSEEEEGDGNILWHLFIDGSIDLRQCIRVRQERGESGCREWLLEQVRKEEEKYRKVA